MKRLFPKVQIHFQRNTNVQKCKFDILLEAYHPDSMTSPGLKNAFDTLEIFFEGYQTEGGLPFIMPEVRIFTQQVHKRWPYAPFFCDVSNSFIILDAFASLTHFSVLDDSRTNQIALTVDRNELSDYMRRTQIMLDDLGRRAALSPSVIEHRKASLRELLRKWFGRSFEC